MTVDADRLMPYLQWTRIFEPASLNERSWSKFVYKMTYKTTFTRYGSVSLLNEAILFYWPIFGLTSFVTNRMALFHGLMFGKYLKSIKVNRVYFLQLKN